MVPLSLKKGLGEDVNSLKIIVFRDFNIKNCVCMFVHIKNCYRSVHAWHDLGPSHMWMSLERVDPNFLLQSYMNYFSRFWLTNCMNGVNQGLMSWK